MTTNDLKEIAKFLALVKTCNKITRLWQIQKETKQ